jgi:hypothetical protein
LTAGSRRTIARLCDHVARAAGVSRPAPCRGELASPGAAPDAQQGWLKSEWGFTEKNREARFYSLTAKGRKQLAAEEESWARFTEGVGKVLGYV